MRRGEPERASQTLRLRVRRNYCWDEKSKTGEKNPASAMFAGMPGYDRTGQDREGHHRQNARAPLGSGRAVRIVCEQPVVWRILS